MPLKIVRNDITKMEVDAVVNSAAPDLLGGGGADGAIHKAAGPELLSECRALGGCKVGMAKVTKGYGLPAKHVIHTVAPRWIGSRERNTALLKSCYKEALCLAASLSLESVAFPLISSGAFGCPKELALKVATEAVTEFLLENEMTVYIAVYDRESYKISKKLFFDISAFIDDNYVLEKSLRAPSGRMRASESAPVYTAAAPFAMEECSAAPSLEDILSEIDESFSEMLLRKIDERGMKDSECYKKANIDRKLFSKIRSDKGYKPSKPTAIAFAIALELDLSETEEMLKKAGFALSRSNKSDLIIEYFIRKKNYNIHEINEALFAFDQSLLGA